jgi:hypothetical protein
VIGRRGKPAEPVQRGHPDPAVEHELEGIRQLKRLAAGIEAQIVSYRLSIDETHDSDAKAVGNFRRADFYTAGTEERTASKVLEMNRARRAEAEASVRRESERLMALQAEIASRIGTVDRVDLEYL